MTRQKMLVVAFAVMLLIIAGYQVVQNYQTNKYIRETKQRDTAQERCITDQAVWLQDWLHWRWVDHIDATAEQIREYQGVHPLPVCRINNS